MGGGAPSALMCLNAPPHGGKVRGDRSWARRHHSPRVGAAALACLISEATQNGASFGRIVAIGRLCPMNMIIVKAYAAGIAGREESPVRNSTPEDGISAPSGTHLATLRYR